MPRGVPQPNRELLICVVAYLRSRGEPVQAIARKLGVSDSLVSNLAKEARRLKLLAEVDRLSSTQTSAVQAYLAGHQYNKGLSQALSELALRDVKVRCCPIGDPGQPAEMKMATFGRAAAVHVHKILTEKSVRSMGVAYGSTVRSVADGLLDSGRRVPRDLDFVPLRGDALIDNPLETPTALCRRLHDLPRRGRQPIQPPRRYSLTGVPPVVPAALRTPSQRAAFWEYLGDFEDFEYCFGGSRPEGNCQLNLLDVILTSVGPPSAVSPYTQRLHELADFSADPELLVGDLAGIPILEPEAAVRDVKAVADLETRLIGVRREHFRQAAEKGVVCVLVAFDTERVKCIREVAKQGLMTDLLVGDPVAEALVQELRTGEPGPAAGLTPPRRR